MRGCFSKIKKALEKGQGVKVTKDGNYIIIRKNRKQLERYNLMFVEYSQGNLLGFIEYWEYRLDIKK